MKGLFIVVIRHLVSGNTRWRFAAADDVAVASLTLIAWGSSIKDTHKNMSFLHPPCPLLSAFDLTPALPPFWMSVAA